MTMKARKRRAIKNACPRHTVCAGPRKHINRLARLLAILTVACLLGPYLTLAQEFNYVEPEKLLRQIEAKTDMVLLDAQSGEKYANAHIKGALDYAGTGQEVENLDLPHSRPIVVYCDCDGDEASRFLANRLIKNGYKVENIFVLKGGWYRWLELGYPVEKGNHPQISK
jgi:rhodanese-related sulfurtransferase